MPDSAVAERGKIAARCRAEGPAATSWTSAAVMSRRWRADSRTIAAPWHRDSEARGSARPSGAGSGRPRATSSAADRGAECPARQRVPGRRDVRCGVRPRASAATPESRSRAGGARGCRSGDGRGAGRRGLPRARPPWRTSRGRCAASGRHGGAARAGASRCRWPSAADAIGCAARATASARARRVWTWRHRAGHRCSTGAAAAGLWTGRLWGGSEESACVGTGTSARTRECGAERSPWQRSRGPRPENAVTQHVLRTIRGRCRLTAFCGQAGRGARRGPVGWPAPDGTGGRTGAAGPVDQPAHDESGASLLCTGAPRSGRCDAAAGLRGG